MLEPKYTGPFKKDRKIMEKRRKNMQKLREVMTLLISEQPLLPRHENHHLHGNYKGKWECHVEPNWLLIYEIDPVNRRIIFHRTGSHPDLYKQ